MKNLKIRSKLIVLVSVLLALLIFIGSLSVFLIGQVNGSTTMLANTWIPGITLAEEINTQTSNFRIQEYKHILSQTSGQMEDAESQMVSLQKEINENLSEYVKVAVDDYDRSMIAEIKSIWEQYLLIHEDVMEESKNNRPEKARELMAGDSLRVFNDLDVKCNNIVAFNTKGSLEASAKGDSTFSMSIIMILTSIGVALVVSTLLAYFIVQAITKPVREISLAAKKLSQGDMEVELFYHSKDEIGMLSDDMRNLAAILKTIISDQGNILREMAGGNFDLHIDNEAVYVGQFHSIYMSMCEIISSLSKALRQINQSADQVSSGSDQVSSGAQSLSQGATEQASSVEELAATINEISTQVQYTARNALEARNQTLEAGNETETCNQQMSEMIKAMDEISFKSTEIGKIIKTIEDIAFQTNILALNAAVEAARAGAAGKGFAVVADEVRNLASKSAEASQNTSGLIASSIEAVEKGTKIANETAESLSRVVQGTKTVAATVEKIADAANEQALSVNQVTQGIDQISSVVQNNSATSEESAAASQELSGQAQKLRGLVSQFKLKQADYTATT